MSNILTPSKESIHNQQLLACHHRTGSLFGMKCKRSKIGANSLLELFTCRRLAKLINSMCWGGGICVHNLNGPESQVSCIIKKNFKYFCNKETFPGLLFYKDIYHALKPFVLQRKNIT